MLQFTKSLWNDEAGFVISAELALVSTLCVLGLVVGLSSVRDAVNCELTDLSTAICSLDQSYYYTGFHSRKYPGCCTTKAWTAGSAFIQGNKGCTNCVDFVTTSNVAPCQTCTTESAVIATPAPAVVTPEPAKVIEQPKTEAVPCPPAALPVVPAPQPTSLVCPPAAPEVNVTCPQPVSTICPAPATCPTQSNGTAPVGDCSAPVICQPACEVVPAARPVLVPQRQLITW
jgi:hypothetical protein